MFNSNIKESNSDSDRLGSTEFDSTNFNSDFQTNTNSEIPSTSFELNKDSTNKYSSHYISDSSEIPSTSYINTNEMNSNINTNEVNTNENSDLEESNSASYPVNSGFESTNINLDIITNTNSEIGSTEFESTILNQKNHKHMKVHMEVQRLIQMI
jgi:hypothetical protein